MGIQGEFWLIGGHADFCDGDVGDDNHESVVLCTVLNNHGMEGLEEYESATLDELVALGFTSEELALFDYSSSADPREYAQREWGWHRLEGNRVETFVITKSTLADIADGLFDAYGEDVEVEEFDIFESKANRFYQ